jgi:hypothetical protein
MERDPRFSGRESVKGGIPLLEKPFTRVSLLETVHGTLNPENNRWQSLTTGDGDHTALCQMTHPQAAA